MKRILNSDGQQSHEYQQNEQIASTSTHCKLKKTIAYDVGNPDPDLLQAQYVEGLDLHQFTSIQKDHILSQK